MNTSRHGLLPAPQGTRLLAMSGRSIGVVMLILVMLGVGCQKKKDPLVAEYSSMSSGRPDGGWSIKFFASGKCEVNGPIPAAGTYSSNSLGYKLQTVMQAKSVPNVISKAVYPNETNDTTLISVNTNGTEYLLDPSKFRSFQRTADTNILLYELKRIL